MKTNRTTLSLLFLVFAVIFAVTSTPALAMTEELVGAVIQTDQGVALSTNAGEYLVAGKDLKPYVGETVAVTGDVEDGALAKTINVASLNVLSSRDIIDPATANAVRQGG